MLHKNKFHMSFVFHKTFHMSVDLKSVLSIYLTITLDKCSHGVRSKLGITWWSLSPFKIFNVRPSTRYFDTSTSISVELRAITPIFKLRACAVFLIAWIGLLHLNARNSDQYCTLLSLPTKPLIMGSAVGLSNVSLERNLMSYSECTLKSGMVVVTLTLGSLQTNEERKERER